MYKLYYSLQSKQDLISIKKYITEKSYDKGVALRYTEKLRQQCRKLAELPATMGRDRSELKHGLRSFPFDNYIIFFQYQEDVLEVVTIIEAHRDISAML